MPYFYGFTADNLKFVALFLLSGRQPNCSRHFSDLKSVHIRARGPGIRLHENEAKSIITPNRLKFVKKRIQKIAVI